MTTLMTTLYLHAALVFLVAVLIWVAVYSMLAVHDLRKRVGALEPKDELDQATALVLLRSEQMTTRDYLDRCRANGWDPKPQAFPQQKDGR